MNKFSKRSLNNLKNVDARLVELAHAVLARIDIVVICGHRNEADQNKAFESGFSKLKFPHSKHNRLPSQAIDIVPCPVDWNNIKRFEDMVTIVKEEAEKLGLEIVCGADWRMRDYPHVQLK